MLSVTAMLVAGAALMEGESWVALLQVCVLGCAAMCAASHNSICACTCRAELPTCLPGLGRPPPWLHVSWLPRKLLQGKTSPPLQEVRSCLHRCPGTLLSTLAFGYKACLKWQRDHIFMPLTVFPHKARLNACSGTLCLEIMSCTQRHRGCVACLDHCTCVQSAATHDIIYAPAWQLLSASVASALSAGCVCAGCFWGLELAYQRVPGVTHTSVGYTAGQDTQPDYRKVCSGRTGHAEAVQVCAIPPAPTMPCLLGAPI